MARPRFFRHSHESSLLNFGHFGTATYEEHEHEWHFIRDPSSTSLNAVVPLLRVISGIENLIPASLPRSAEPLRNHDLNTLVPGFNPKELLTDLVLEETAKHNFEPFAIGSAFRLVEDDKQSSHTVSIAAYISGDNHDTLELRCIGKSHIECEGTRLRVPSINDIERSSWPTHHPILQICFSSTKFDSQRDTLLAIRQASCTTILKPLLHPQRSSTLNPNVLTTIPSSMTGGASHAHVSFHPQNSKFLAIVDTEGNWSIWSVEGERRYDAKVSYQTHLHASGKVFSFEDKKRADHVGLFHDGWHKSCWLSNDKKMINRMLICNRQTACLFDLEGSLICEIDARLGKKSRGRWILEIKSIFDDSHCLILTDRNLLLFSASQHEWRDTKSAESPQLLCAWTHFRNASPGSLEINVCYDKNNAVVILTTPGLDLATVYYFRNTSSSSLNVQTSDSLTLHLPPLPSNVTSTKVRLLQVSQKSSSSPPTPQLIVLFLYVADQSIHYVLLELSSTLRLERGTPLLRLPSKKVGFPSARHVGDDQNEELSIFITESDQETWPTSNASASRDRSNTKRITVDSINLESTYSELMKQISSQSKIHASPILERISNGLDQRLKQPIDSISSLAVLVSDLAPLQTQVTDIEHESSILHNHLQALTKPHKNRLIDNVESHASNQTLMHIYQQLFESYVSSMAPSIPGRIRLQRERLARDMSLQIYLSNFIIWTTTADEESSSLKPIPTTSHNGDPVEVDDHNIADSPSFASHPHVAGFTQSPISDALTILSRFTKISSPPDISTTQEVSDILAHLPSSPDVDPSTYSYSNIELDLAVQRGKDFEASLDPSAQRKIKKTKKSKQRAMQRQSQVRDAAQSQGQTIPSIFTGSQALVIRNAQSSQLQPSEMSSPLAERIAMTQPEGGTHGSRRETKKKPKKRVAGF